MTIRDKINNGLVILGASVAVLVAGKTVLIPDTKLEVTRREVEILADTNKDGRTTEEEWAPVYRELGVEPYITGFDFNHSQLKQYLKNHRGEQ